MAARLPALIPAPSACLPVYIPWLQGGGKHSLNKGRERKGYPGDEALQAGPQGAARGTISPGSKQRDHRVGRGLGRMCKRGCWRGGWPGVLSRLLRLGHLVPEDFRLDLGFGAWDPGLGSEGEAGG